MTSLEFGKYHKNRARKHLEKYNFLLLKCRKCHQTFTCSGHCIKNATERLFQDKGCYCYECDTAKEDWKGRCKKNDLLLDSIRKLAKKEIKGGKKVVSS